MTTKIGRNEPCPCGSGRKYKRCHGSGVDDDTSLQARVFAKFAEMEAKEQANRRQYGEGRDILSAVASGQRATFVGDRWLSMPEKSCQFFTDFLRANVIHLLGREWGNGQLVLAEDARNPLITWDNRVCAQVKNAVAAGVDGVSAGFTYTGAVLAFYRIARDLYQIEHNAEFQTKVLARLRHLREFQGARFELAVAAAMVSAGYNIAYPPPDVTKKLPDLISESKDGKVRLAIEAKSRRRFGVLCCKEGAPDRQDLGIHTLLNDALTKDRMGRHLIVCVDLNLPDKRPDDMPEIQAELQRIVNETQGRYPNGYPAAAAFFFNDCAHYHLDTTFDSTLLNRSVWCYSFQPKRPLLELPNPDLLDRILDGFMQRAALPSDWPNPNANRIG